MNKKNPSKTSSFFGLLISLFIVSSLMFVACDADPVSMPDEGVELHSEALMDELNKRANGNQVTICHFPPGNPDNPQKLTIGVNAAANHISNHDGDGIVGVDYDENCQPLVVAVDCPCYSAEDLDALIWTEFYDDETESGYDTGVYQGRSSRIFAFVIWNENNINEPGSCLFRNDPVLIQDKSLSKDQADACRALLLDVDVDSNGGGGKEEDESKPLPPKEKDPKEEEPPVKDTPKEAEPVDPKEEKKDEKKKEEEYDKGGG